MNDHDGPHESGLGDDTVSNVIYANFQRRVQISADEYFRGADRCQAAADRARDPNTRRILQDAAGRYREQGRQRF